MAIKITRIQNMKTLSDKRETSACPLTEALGQVGLLVDEDLGGDDGAEGLEGGDQVRVGELLRQVVDEEVVGAVPARPRPLLHAAAVRGLQLAACNIAGLDI